jgi:putative pyruvate formate lyase activating enzyme
MMYPAFLQACKNGSLDKLIAETHQMLESCSICPRKCGVNRLKNEVGFCKTGLKARVYSFLPHFGEEPPISGERGSGTIFFSYCNMRCLYCQNYRFSQLGEGREVEEGELADFMLQLQGLGCHNINLVTPTHVLPQILAALKIAIDKGLKIPLVYNTSGYELAEIIRLLDGIVDIYLPDARYADSSMAEVYSAAKDYPKHNQESVKEMSRQVGIAKLEASGIIKRGLIIRHLVLPGGISGSEKIMRFIAREIGPDTYISLMSQYQACYQAAEMPALKRRISYEEYLAVQEAMAKYGLCNGWTQEDRGLERFLGTNIKPR